MSERFESLRHDGSGSDEDAVVEAEAAETEGASPTDDAVASAEAEQAADRNKPWIIRDVPEQTRRRVRTVATAYGLPTSEALTLLVYTAINRDDSLKRLFERVNDWE